ncbi:hypothetical protein MFLAVUS_006948 [Mucor flavus]|uniref:RhoGAP-domain-containing protein n=1 Tax=Mucor flavus TaxID=439312 RepID=A0ABP9Z2X6_9FUNG
MSPHATFIENSQNFKQQSEQYWKIIEKQRKIIQTLQKSLSSITSENEQLIKKNQELEASMPDVKNVAHLSFEPSIPVLPPRSPYRVHRDQPKRPPVLQLSVSNHHKITSPLSPQSVSSNVSFEYPAVPSHKRGTTRRSSVSPNGTAFRHKKRESQHEKIVMKASKSEPSTPVKPCTPRFESLMMPQLNDQNAPPVLTNLSNIRIKVISSSNHIDARGKEFPLFIIGIIQKKENYEIWRIEKNLIDILNLDSQLKHGSNAYFKKLPEKAISHAPSKVDERKTMIEDYLQHAISLKTINLVILCDFLSSDQICHLPSLANDTIKHGYLTKRGKNFGGWISRYFVLDQSGLLKYYENKDGKFLGKIKLMDSQIGCQPQENDSYRHAFLILEPRSNGSHQKHIFCANSDLERDGWVDALRYYTHQVHITEDVMNSFFSEDTDMSDQLIVEPSSSTESAKTTPTARRRPSVEHLFKNFGTRRRSSLSKDFASHLHQQQEDEDKKSKHRISRKLFWGKKKFGNHTLAHEFKYIQDDFEETKGDFQVFGVALQNAVMVARVCDQYQLPAIVHRCIEYMEAKDGLVEEGIYRSNGSSALMKKLKKRFNNEGDIKLLEDDDYHDVHAIAGLLKMWLREMPENILTDALLADFSQSIDIPDRGAKRSQVGKLVSYLPLVNYTLLRSLCAHLIRVIENADKNKMTLRNISIVFSATLDIPSSIFNLLLVEFDYIFWTDRCQDQTVPVTTHPLVKNLVRDESCRSKRNSIHYQDNTPRDFILLEKQLNAVIDDLSPLEDESYYSDGELEVAYFASRYTANSRHPLED